jgi:sigma-54 specific flagellar transcriptional regulator A
MDYVGNLLLIDADDKRRQQLETVLSFMSLQWQSGDEEDCLAYLEASSTVSAVIVGALAQTTSLALIEKYPQIPFILCDGESLSSSNFIGILQQPVELESLTQLLHFCQAFRSLHPTLQTHQQVPTLLKLLVGKGKAIQNVRKLIEQVASKDANVLILGESGTGKEVVARAIHELSGRAQGPFVPVNCGAIPAELLESELFGHEKGAFTGAISSRQGRFELADGGTLFLDEIGDMPMPMQVKLLRVLQERTFERVGGTKPIKCNVRIIAATHRELEQMIAEQKFREDLFYRLNVFPIETPPLRERLDDIPLLLQEMVARHQGQHHAYVRFTQRALTSLMQHNWPGNVRELSNLIERLLILFPNQIVDVMDLPVKYRYGEFDSADDIALQQEMNTSEWAERDALAAVLSDDPDVAPLSGAAESFMSVLPDEGINLKEMIAELEVSLIRQALEIQDGVIARAAELLGMRRTTLVEKMKKYGMAAKE